jgi:hypothetical protein
MGKKFDAIYESVISRSEAGGYLPGDLVKFRNGYKSTETYKSMPSTLQKEVDELVSCGLNIKVVQVGDKQSGYSIGNQFKPASQVVITIAADHGGGRTYGRVSVTPDMIDVLEPVGSGTIPVPDQWKKKDVVIIKPKRLKTDPNNITNVTDKGNGKNTPTNLKLAGESARPWESIKDLGMIYSESMLKSPTNDAVLFIKESSELEDIYNEVGDVYSAEPEVYEAGYDAGYYNPDSTSPEEIPKNLWLKYRGKTYGKNDIYDASSIWEYAWISGNRDNNDDSNSARGASDDDYSLHGEY